MHDYLSDITIARALQLRCDSNKGAANDQAASIELEVVATPRANGGECLVDAFFDPKALGAQRKGHLAGDANFLSQLKAALAKLGFPTDSLVYASDAAQDDHLVAFEAGSDFAQAVLKLVANSNGDGAVAAA
jgi:hypothetical protein